MTAPLPSPRPVLLAEMTDALRRLTIGRLYERVNELEFLIVRATEIGHARRTALNFADSDAAGYIDRTDIWGTQ